MIEASFLKITIFWEILAVSWAAKFYARLRVLGLQIGQSEPCKVSQKSTPGDSWRRNWSISVVGNLMTWEIVLLPEGWCHLGVLKLTADVNVAFWPSSCRLRKELALSTFTVFTKQVAIRIYFVTGRLCNCIQNQLLLYRTGVVGTKI